LPLEQEEMEPGFIHHPTASLPELTLGGATVRVIMGAASGCAWLPEDPQATRKSEANARQVRMPAV
jgi:redox-sensitive bicupin YhaK (pirin superfamily)